MNIPWAEGGGALEINSPLSLSMGQALWVIMIVAGPPLILMFVIGFVISIIQTATSLHEPTISFIPKLPMLVLFIAIYGASAGDRLIANTRDLWLDRTRTRLHYSHKRELSMPTH